MSLLWPRSQEHTLSAQNASYTKHFKWLISIFAGLLLQHKAVTECHLCLPLLLLLRRGAKSTWEIWHLLKCSLKRSLSIEDVLTRCGIIIELELLQTWRILPKQHMVWRHVNVQVPWSSRLPVYFLSACKQSGRGIHSTLHWMIWVQMEEHRSLMFARVNSKICICPLKNKLKIVLSVAQAQQLTQSCFPELKWRSC